MGTYEQQLRLATSTRRSVWWIVCLWGASAGMWACQQECPGPQPRPRPDAGDGAGGDASVTLPPVPEPPLPPDDCDSPDPGDCDPVDPDDPSGEPTFGTATFFVDDSANQSYTAADGLAWKGSFAYDRFTNTIRFDGSWSGPFVMLHDDGPISAGGHEPEGAVAGDHVWSVAVQVRSVDFDQTYEYGALRGSVQGSDGEWIWSGANGTFTVPAGADGTLVEVPGLTIPKWGWVDLRLELNTDELDPLFQTEIQLITVKSSSWGWTEVRIDDEDGDGRYEFVLSEHIGPGNALEHAGLLNPGGEPEFVWVINDIEYKVLGIPPGEEGGVRAAVKLGGEWVPQPITLNDKNNTIITVPWAPPADWVTLNFSVDDSASKTYDGGLAWKGSFLFDPDSRTLAYDELWSGPFVMLHDDGPWTEGGHEPIGAVAGDHVWGATVWCEAPKRAQTFEYGAISGSVDGSDGDWIWDPDTNGTFTVPADDLSPITVPGLVLP